MNLPESNLYSSPCVSRPVMVRGPGSMTSPARSLPVIVRLRGAAVLAYFGPKSIAFWN